MAEDWRISELQLDFEAYGSRSLIGSCSLVTGDVPPGVVATGQPARVTATVTEVVERHAQRAATDPSRLHVPASSWRDRSEADFANLDLAIVAILQSNPAPEEHSR